jgi:hypothetical protein
MYDLYWFFSEPRNANSVSIDSVFQTVISQTSEEFFQAAIEHLLTNRLISYAADSSNEIKITPEGITYVDSELDNPDSYICDINDRRPAASRTSIPASDRFVEIDHNSKEYQDVLQTKERLLEELRKSNSFAATPEDEVEKTITEIEAGYRLLDAKRVNPTVVKALLGAALIYVATKFADEPVGELAAMAWQAVKNLFGF